MTSKLFVKRTQSKTNYPVKDVAVEFTNKLAENTSSPNHLGKTINYIENKEMTPNVKLFIITLVQKCKVFCFLAGGGGICRNYLFSLSCKAETL